MRAVKHQDVEKWLLTLSEEEIENACLNAIKDGIQADYYRAQWSVEENPVIVDVIYESCGDSIATP